MERTAAVSALMALITPAAQVDVRLYQQLIW
jgi:hypothetical protein